LPATRPEPLARKRASGFCIRGNAQSDPAGAEGWFGGKGDSGGIWGMVETAGAAVLPTAVMMEEKGVTAVFSGMVAAAAAAVFRPSS